MIYCKELYYRYTIHVIYTHWAQKSITVSFFYVQKVLLNLTHLPKWHKLIINIIFSSLNGGVYHQKIFSSLQQIKPQKPVFPQHKILKIVMDQISTQTAGSKVSIRIALESELKEL